MTVLKPTGFAFPMFADGIHPGRCVAIEEHSGVIFASSGDPLQRPRDVVRLIFGVWVGNGASLCTPGWTTLSIKPRSKLLPLLTSMCGQVPQYGLDLKSFIGKPFAITTQVLPKTSPNGMTRQVLEVMKAVPIDDGQAPPMHFFAPLWEKTKLEISQLPPLWIRPEERAPAQSAFAQAPRQWGGATPAANPVWSAPAANTPQPAPQQTWQPPTQPAQPAPQSPPPAAPLWTPQGDATTVPDDIPL
jgi:hypothetical protein